MIGSTMFTYALYAGMLRDAGLKPMSVTKMMETEMASVDDPNRILRVETRLDTADSMKKSPKYDKWVFSHVSTAYGQTQSKNDAFLRFRVFAEDQATIQGMGNDSNRLLIRLWDYSWSRLKREKYDGYDWIDVYLCKEGDREGAEHSFGHDSDEPDRDNQARLASVIHLFKIGTLTNNLEKVRELAHEFGHAIYPEVGAFDAPESWGNGYAAERVFIKWLHDDMKAKKITPADAMGATEAELASYLAAKVDPLVLKMGSAGPNLTLLAGKGQDSFNEYLALNSYAQAILPPPAFMRAVVLGASDEGASFFAKQVVEAAAEREELPITIPAVLKGKAMWVPLAKGTIKGAKVLEKKGSWAKVQPTSETVVIVNPPVG